MSSRLLELVSLGPELRRLAEHRGQGVNEAMFLVHEILAEAFQEPHKLPGENLRDHLAKQLERKLDNRPEKSRKARTLWPPLMWQIPGRRSAPQKAIAAAADQRSA